MKLRLAVILGILFVFFAILFKFYPLIIFPKSMTMEQATDIMKRSNLRQDWYRFMRRYLKSPLDQHYGSHAIVLLATAFLSPSGPILELGMGSTSTPLLSRLSQDQRRILVSADSDRRWINYFSSLSSNNSFHRFKHVEIKTEMGVEWAMNNLEDMEAWNIVFIDHRPGPRRKFDLMGYSQRSDLVILHDTEQTSMYQYHEGLKYYPYQFRFNKLTTFTDVLSTRNQTIINEIRYLLQSTSILKNGTLGEMI